MASTLGAGRCIHCLQEVSERDWDHVLPKSWYPDTTPENLEKWKAPSCIPCNRENGRVEERLLKKLSLCLDPSSPASKGIVEKTLRALNPASGRDQKDQENRAKQRQAAIDGLIEFRPVHARGLLPNFGPQLGFQAVDQYVVKISAKDIDALTKKMVRGTAYVLDELFIDGECNLDTYVIEDRNAVEVIELLKQTGNELYRGPGLTIRRAVVPEDKRCGLYAIEIWQRFKLYASVSLPSHIEKSPA